MIDVLVFVGLPAFTVIMCVYCALCLVLVLHLLLFIEQTQSHVFSFANLSRGSFDSL